MQADIEDIPGEPDSGNQEGLHYKAPQDLFNTRPLLLRPGYIADLSNT